MELLLPAFSTSQPIDWLNPWEADFFHLMPPLSLNPTAHGGLGIESCILLFYDRLILDRNTYDRLTTEPTLPYRATAELMKRLADEDFIRLEDFEQTLLQKREVLDSMLSLDLKNITVWKDAFISSKRIWIEFCRSLINHNLTINLKGEIEATIARDEQLVSELHITNTRKKGYRENLRENLQSYLRYINSTLVISGALDVPFYDWQDFEPFYRMKFLNIGKLSNRPQAQANQVRKIFDLMLPSVRTLESKKVIKFLKDPRVKELKGLIEDSMSGRIQFDAVFAAKLMETIVKEQLKIARWTRVASFVAFPIGFIPLAGSFIGKGVDELTAWHIKHRIQAKNSWFYLIQDISSD